MRIARLLHTITTQLHLFELGNVTTPPKQVNLNFWSHTSEVHISHSALQWGDIIDSILEYNFCVFSCQRTFMANELEQIVAYT